MTGPAHDLVEEVRRVFALDDVDEGLLLDVVGEAATLRWSAGSEIFGVGDEADALYLVLSGRVRLEDPDGANRDLEPGGYFGEHALLAGTERRRRAEAVDDCELMLIPADRFERLLGADPALARRFEDELVTAEDE